MEDDRGADGRAPLDEPAGTDGLSGPAADGSRPSRSADPELGGPGHGDRRGRATAARPPHDRQAATV